MADDWVSIGLALYVGVGLFLSLYFVPFKVVPRAWAKAVGTKGHPAQVALDAVLEAAAPKVAAAVKMPAMPDPAKFEALVTQFNVLVPLVNQMAVALGDEELAKAIDAAMKRAYGKTIKEKGQDRGIDGQIIERASAEPEAAAYLQKAIRALDLMAKGGLIKPVTAKAYTRELREAFANGEDLQTLAASFGINMPGGGVATGGSSSGHYG